SPRPPGRRAAGRAPSIGRRRRGSGRGAPLAHLSPDRGATRRGPPAPRADRAQRPGRGGPGSPAERYRGGHACPSASSPFSIPGGSTGLAPTRVATSAPSRLARSAARYGSSPRRRPSISAAPQASPAPVPSTGGTEGVTGGT